MSVIDYCDDLYKRFFVFVEKAGLYLYAFSLVCLYGFAVGKFQTEERIYGEVKF